VPMMNTNSIKAWSPDERPREKLILKGTQALSDAELLALLIGSGSREESALDMARRILQGVKHDLQALGSMKCKELTQFKGMGPAKAVVVVAALELAKRKMASVSKQSASIRHSRDAYERMLEYMWNLPHEEFWVITLSKANRVLSVDKVGEGGLSATIADPKKVFRIALENNAASIIVAHNHPSGNREPSNEDRQLTKRLVYCGQMLECPVIDHLVVTDNGYYSFCDENELKE